MNIRPIRPALLLSASFILSLSLLSASLKASPVIDEEPKPLQSSGLQPTDESNRAPTVSLATEQSNSEDRSKGKETSEVFDASSSSSPSTSTASSILSTKKPRAEQSFSRSKIIGVLAAQLSPEQLEQTLAGTALHYDILNSIQRGTNAPLEDLIDGLTAQSQHDILNFIFSEYNDLVSQREIGDDFFCKLIDSCSAALPAEKQDETLESFNMRVQLIVSFEDMLKTLDNALHLKEFSREGKTSSNKIVRNMHNVQMKLLQFYIRTLNSVKQVSNSLKDSQSQLSEDASSDRSEIFKEDILNLILKLKDHISLSRGLCGLRATAEDHHLFGQAYDALIRAQACRAERSAFQDNHIIGIYRDEAVKMYEVMLILLKGQATPEHYRLRAPRLHFINQVLLNGRCSV